MRLNKVSGSVNSFVICYLCKFLYTDYGYTGIKNLGTRSFWESVTKNLFRGKPSVAVTRCHLAEWN